MSELAAFIVFVLGALFILAVLSAPTSFDPSDHPTETPDE